MTKTNQKIPEGWSVKRLDDIGDFISGVGFPEKEQGGQIGIPFYKVSDMNLPQNDIYMKVSNNYVTDKQIEAMHIAPIRRKAILFAKVGAAIFLERKRIAENFLCDNNMMCFLPFNFSNYLKYAFDNLRLSKYSQVGALPSYNASDLSSIKLPVPPLPEQEKIAEILGCWDDGIEKLSRLIEQKKRLKKGLMQRLLNFKKEYLKRFDEIFEDYSDKKHSDKDLLSATQENGVIPRRLLKGRVMSPEGSLDGYKLVRSGSFVISLRSFQGGLEYSDYEGIISPAYTVIKDKIPINKCFYRYFFKSYNFIEKYLSIAVIGIRDGKQISYPDLQSVKIPYPPLSEQKAIADILSKADEEITLLTKKLSALKSQKKGLMQKLLTGQIRVKVN